MEGPAGVCSYPPEVPDDMAALAVVSSLDDIIALAVVRSLESFGALRCGELTGSLWGQHFIAPSLW